MSVKDHAKATAVWNFTNAVITSGFIAIVREHHKVQLPPHHRQVTAVKAALHADFPLTLFEVGHHCFGDNGFSQSVRSH